MKKILLFILSLIVFSSVFSQTGNDTTKYTYYKNTYGNRLQRYWADSVLNIPSDTTHSKWGLARKGTVLYVGNGTLWTAVGTSGAPTLQQVIDNGNRLNRNDTIIGTNDAFGFPLNSLSFDSIQQYTFNSSGRGNGVQMYGSGGTASFQVNGHNISSTVINAGFSGFGYDYNSGDSMYLGVYKAGVDTTEIHILDSGVRFTRYGQGLRTAGTATYNLGVTSSGKIIEVATGGGSGTTPGIDTVLGKLQKLTTDRKIRGGGHILNLDSLTITASDTGSNYFILKILPTKPSESSQVNFNLTRSYTANPFGQGDEVVNWGFNAGTNASPETAGKGAMFWSMEQGYRPSSPTVSLWEWHQEFVNFAGTNRRISSFTINNAEAANPDIDYYMTASRFYIKSPVTGNTQFSVGDFNNTAATSLTLSTSAWTSTYNMNTSGLQINDVGGTGAGRQFEVDGFGTGNLGGQLGWVAGAQTFVITGAVGTNPLNIRDGSTHHSYLYNSGTTGQITLSNSGDGNYPTIFNSSSTSSSDYGAFSAINDLGAQMILYSFGSTHAPSGVAAANTGTILSSNSNGIAVAALSGAIKFAANGTTEDAQFSTAGHLLMTTHRFQLAKGANVTSATNMTLGADGNVFHITGTNTINNIITTNWQAGSEIILIFDGSLTLKNNTSGGGGTVILLAGGIDFSATSNDIVKLVYDGTSLFEEGRSVN
jgi:hypothetical protein